ncbi:MAG: hypothetical protein A2Y10_00620 [Planctomycetes bacterium GWF2_41_51]|nr:MAG: hypothetical protein A2Y10_00620 [Planctomycetes bacterium GWF2_41_51]HBG25931.1 hypothetical protein [Phycisphaerales bacterium]
MAEKEYQSNKREADVERSTEVIRQDIAKGEENISQTVGQISERLKEKLDWRGYVRESPYLAMGAAAGLGYLVSKMFQTHATPKERIMREVRESLGGLHAGTTGQGLLQVTLLGIATKVVADWIENATSTSTASSDQENRPPAESGSTINSKVDTSKVVKIKN